jgi:glycosyltransferase involved in cell wall biosynthesis
MKILIVINSLKAGGAERQVLRDANLLTKAGHEVVVCYGTDGPLLTDFNDEVNLKGLHTLSPIRSSIKLFRYLRKNKFDIVLSHMFWAIKISAIPCVATGQKVIFFEHGLGLWRKWYHLILLHILDRFTARIVVVSQAKKKIKIGREKFSSECIEVIPNSFKPVSPLSFKNSANGCFTICYAGRFDAVKQLHLFLKIAETLCAHKEKFKVILMGDGDENEKIKKLIYRENLDKYFELTGYIKNPQKIMKDADAFVLPSKREDFSVALLEASSVGLPCLAFDVGGNSEIIQDGKTGFIIPPLNIQCMVEKINFLIKNPETKIKIGNQAREFVNSNFSEEKRLKRLNSLIDSIIR